ncbi:SDR family NAD(P)-dependent oxidoreductase [Roseibium sp. MMSF_3544]|uniref:SDR family NAD(P)-dependent oxidoreductase n=1 Tax=unclassified Roseibium TaxID=2629323 RepID=UPI00273D55C6|nr:SDR family oxidoreductase [Roseibium sp. MMSF_3544]
MTYDLQGKTALVTGGARGIGAAIVERLASEGVKTAFTYVSNQATAEDLASRLGPNTLAIQADAADPGQTRAAVAKTVDAFGHIDILVHNAGVFRTGPITDFDFDAYRQQSAINVDAVYAGTHAAVPHIPDGGRIIVISSVNAKRMPFEGFAAYGATKAATTALVKGWARDLGARNILVNAIQPGPVDTDLNPAAGPFFEPVSALTALKRYGNPSEIANIVAFLASDQASFITGAAIDVDGGMAL